MDLPPCSGRHVHNLHRRLARPLCTSSECSRAGRRTGAASSCRARRPSQGCTNAYRQAKRLAWWRQQRRAKFWASQVTRHSRAEQTSVSMLTSASSSMVMQAGALACRCLPLASTQRSLLRCHGAAAILVLLFVSSVQCCHAVPLPHRDLQGLSVDDRDCRNELYRIGARRCGNPV